MKIYKHELTRDDVVYMIARGAALAIGKEGDIIEIVIKDTDGKIYVILNEKMPYSFCWGLL